MKQYFTDSQSGEFLSTKPKPNLNTFLNWALTRPAKFTPKAVITQEVQFPDVSFYQGEIDFNVMCLSTDAIIIRVGQNIWKDEQFERNYAKAKACGKKIGIYWFFDGRASPSDQGRVLVAALIGKELELGVYIDWERNYGGGYEGLRNVVALMQMVENAGLNIKEVGMYTGYYFFRANSNPITNASQYTYLKTHPLWLAWYTSNPANVLIPAPWSDLLIWQYGTPVVYMGQKSKEIDMNWFNGTRQEFENRYGEVGVPPMADYMKLTPSVAGEYRSIRQQTDYPTVPHIIGSKIGQIDPYKIGKANPDDFYVYTENVLYNGTTQAYIGDKWWRLYEANGQPVNGWVAEIHKGQRYLVPTLVPDPTNPPTFPPEIILKIDGVEKTYVPIVVKEQRRLITDDFS